jgi:hypothetical protein
MFKIQKLKILILLLIVGSFVTLGQASTSADSYSKEDSDKVVKLCSDKLNIPVKSNKGNDQLILGACHEGYFLGLEGKQPTACDAPYKRVDKALKACKQTGFNLGKANPLNIKSKQQQNGGQGQGGQPGHCNSSNNCDLVKLYVNPFIRVLGIVVGLVVAASLVLGGIQYSASSGDPQKTSAAKSRITNTLLAFMAFAFLYAFLNFLIPGGIFN